MRVEDRNKQIIYELLEATDKREFDVVRKFYHKDFIEHNSNSIAQIDDGRNGVEKAFQALDKIFPLRKHIVEDIIAEKDKVAARITFIAIAKDQIGIPQTSKKDYKITGTAIYRFEDGLIVEKWTHVSVLKELGISLDDFKCRSSCS
ncbi:MAG TPA: ester cyclase [Chryseolinea sp.]|nr:ester cyclase [Chryseolinea sp.]